MALTIATGFVVDDAIVMIENIARYIEQGDAAAARPRCKGSEQIGFTIISLTFSLIAVLIPLLFMGDVVGRLFREFAITLAVAILISAVVSLTLTPMMCARLLRHVPEAEQGALLPRERPAVRQDDRRLRTHARLGARSPGGDFARRARHARAHGAAVRLWCRRASSRCRTPESSRAFRKRRSRSRSTPWPSASRRSTGSILEDPAVESLSSFIGVDGTNATLNSGRVLINLKPLAERGASASAVIRRLQRRSRRCRASACTCSRCRT